MVAWQLAALVLAAPAAGETVMLDFRAEWCGPCQMMDPTVDALARQGYPIRKVDIDRQPDLAKRFRVGPIPTFVMVANGREIDRYVGATDQSQLLSMFRKAAALARLPPDEPPSVGGLQSPDETPLGVEHRDRTDRPQPALITALIHASVLVRIDDGKATSKGSGTIIDARAGEALVLTCAHVFRDSAGRGPIEVVLFGADGPQTVEGQLIGYDLESDVGLIGIKTTGPVAVSRVAPAHFVVRPNDPVINIGCDDGKAPPTAHASRILTVNRFSHAPNFQVAGKPVQGRSGGGLFTPEGLVIGVCNAADKEDNAGLYAGLAAVHTELDKHDLTYVYRTPAGNGSGQAPIEPELHTMPDRFPTRGLPAHEFSQQGQERPNVEPVVAKEPATDSSGLSRLTAEEQAALAELREKARDAEVICIVRPLADSQAKSEIIVIERASPAFLDQLAHPRNAPGREPTSPEVRRADRSATAAQPRADVSFVR